MPSFAQIVFHILIPQKLAQVLVSSRTKIELAGSPKFSPEDLTGAFCSGLARILQPFFFHTYKQNHDVASLSVSRMVPQPTCPRHQVPSLAFIDRGRRGCLRYQDNTSDLWYLIFYVPDQSSQPPTCPGSVALLAQECLRLTLQPGVPARRSSGFCRGEMYHKFGRQQLPIENHTSQTSI